MFEGAEGERRSLLSGGGNSAVLGSLQECPQAMQPPLSLSTFKIFCRNIGGRRGEILGAWNETWCERMCAECPRANSAVQLQLC